jgi:hypothetical protein
MRPTPIQEIIQKAPKLNMNGNYEFKEIIRGNEFIVYSIKGKVDNFCFKNEPSTINSCAKNVGKNG